MSFAYVRFCNDAPISLGWKFARKWSNMMDVCSRIDSKMNGNLSIFRGQGWFGALGDHPGAKARDASWITS